MKIVNIEEHTEAWHEWRATGCNASSAPAVMGESTYFPKTPFQLYQKETGQKEVFVNDAMKDGHKYEPVVLQMINDAADITGSEPYVKALGEKDIETEDGPVKMLASFDGYQKENSLRVVEIKTTVKDSKIWECGERVYYWQMVHQAIVADVSKVQFVAYAKDTDEIRINTVHISEESKVKLIKEWKKYSDCINSFTQPELTKDDYVETDDEDFVKKAEIYNSYKEKKSAIDDAMAEIKAELIEMTGGAPTKGGGITVYPVNRKGNVQYKKIPELKDVDLEKYRAKSSSYWAIK